MFKTLLSKCGLIKKKPQSFGECLNAIKKYFRVIGENQGSIGNRVYACKNNKHLIIETGDALVSNGSQATKQTTLIIHQSPNDLTKDFIHGREFYRAYQNTYNNGKRTQLTTVTRKPNTNDVVKTIKF